MRRGTTPTHTFTLPFSADVIANGRVVYEQGGRTILRKPFSDFTLSGDTVAVTLTQRETLSFVGGKDYRVQLHLLDHNDAALVSNIITDRCEEGLDNEVLE